MNKNAISEGASIVFFMFLMVCLIFCFNLLQEGKPFLVDFELWSWLIKYMSVSFIQGSKLKVGNTFPGIVIKRGEGRLLMTFHSVSVLF